MNKKNRSIGAILSKAATDNMPWIILIVACIIFSFFNNNFFSFANIINILNQNAYIIVCSIGIAFIMMSGQLDLSVGYQLSLIGVVLGLLVKHYSPPAWLLVIVGILLGILLSEINMILAIKLKITLLMVTVATMTTFQGIAYTLSNSKTLTGFSTEFKAISQGMVGPIPVAVILTFVLVIIMSLFLSKTYWGRYVYALGGNEDATNLAGINVVGVKLMIGAIAGAFVGLAAVMLVARVGSAQAGVGPGTEFTIITGILLGGVSIRGGEGKLSGVVAGILLIAILANGMQLAGFGIYMQYIVQGVIMVVAIAIDVIQMSRRKIVVGKNDEPDEEKA